MIITKRLMGKAIATWLGPTGDAARRAVTELREKVTKTPRKLTLYVDVAEPWSYLTAVATSRLLEAYPVDLEVVVVTPPAADVDVFPILRTKHAVRDAKQLAEYWNIDFPGKREADPSNVRDAATSLIRDRPGKEQLRAVLDLTAPMWANDKKELAKRVGAWGFESHGNIAPVLNGNYYELRKAGHYQGGMLSYGGEWYWGIDRLPYLEEVLAKEFGVPVKHVVTPRPEAERGPEKIYEVPEGKPAQPLQCEMWFSFRSPYSYLALEQIEAVLAPHQIPLVLRVVPPMVTRGVPLPTVKRTYIVRDAKREADRLHVPFGEVCDPLGTGTDNCIAIAYWAGETQGQAAMLAFAKSAMRAIWSEARDMAEYVDLKYVVERAGLAWEQAKEALANPEAAKWANANTTDMAVFSLWGVPSIKCGDFVAWGQDRLPLLADRLRRNALVPTVQTPPGASI
ncbi:DsbA family protein [soil metagenome]